MAQRRGFSPRFQRGTRRPTDWGLGPGGQTLTNISASSIAIMGSGIGVTAGKLTIIRTRGEFAGNLLTADAAGAGLFGAFGGLPTRLMRA